MRVLQVEDDAHSAAAVERMLSARGHECKTVGEGVEAVSIATEDPYDVILLDIMLPDIDGYEVIRRLRASDIKTPVVVQSGLIAREEMEKAPAFGVEHYLVKPFTVEELDASIRSAVRPAPAEPQVEGSRRQPIRRQHRRIRTLKSGRIVSLDTTFVTSCLVINISDGGAALQPTEIMRLPSDFVLELQFGPAYRCRVCWRHGNKLGVRFVTEDDDDA